MGNINITPQSAIDSLKADHENGDLTPNHIKQLTDLINRFRSEQERLLADISIIDTEENEESENTEAVSAEQSADNPRELSPEQQTVFLSVLETRLSSKPEHYRRPDGVEFSEVKKALEERPDLMWSLAQMENTGGAVDIRAVTDNEFVFCDFAKETSENRRDLTYYQVDKIAKKWGVDIQSEEGWRALQGLGVFDTSSWIWVRSDDIIDIGYARDARRRGYDLRVYRCDACGHFLSWGWRASLRVPKA